MEERSTPPARSRIKLLALDMDDTLLGHDLAISPGNLRALTAADELGVQVVLASGRPPAGLAPFVQILGMDRRPDFLIGHNGSVIVATDTGQVEWGVALEPAILTELWDLAAQFQQPIQTYDDTGILVNIDNPFTDIDCKLTGMSRRLVGREEFLEQARVKLILPGDPTLLNPVEARCKEVFAGRLNMYRSKPYFFEIMRLEADKGHALERIANLHGIAREEVMAMGDSWNDEGMLRWAGVSVAMANGAEGIRRIASWVTSRGHDDDGVAEAVERFILNV